MATTNYILSKAWIKMLYRQVFQIVCVILLLGSSAFADDWPQWRHDAGRSGVSSEEVAEELHLKWMREFPSPRPAWPEISRLLFDQSYEPVVLGEQMFVPCNANDSLTALDIETGEVQWRFFADGPIRFAPVAWKEHVYFGSDDGYLYSLRTEDGTLAWKFRGGPSNRKILGNGRLISVWPIRGGPVLKEGRIYFTAGIWPFMGVFAHALDAESGQKIWTNDTSGAIYIGGKGGRGASPQGYLTAKNREQLDPLDRQVGDIVIAPCGGSAPILFGQDDGELKHFGGFVPYFANDESQARYHSQKNFGFKKGAAGGWFVTTPNVLSDEYQPYDPEIVTGSQTWNRSNCPPVEGEITSILAADGKLFVVTDLGRLYCFGDQRGEPKLHRLARVESKKDQAKPAHNGDQRAWVAEIVRRTKVADVPGFSLLLGDNSGTLEELIGNTKLDVIVIPRAKQAADLRRTYNQRGLYGGRVHVLPADTRANNLPPYLARLIVAEDASSLAAASSGNRGLSKHGPGAHATDDRAAMPFVATPEKMAAWFARLRPYGGSLCVRLSDRQHEIFAKDVQRAAMPQATLQRHDGCTYLFRNGPLPRAGSWTHEHGDAGNTLFSADGRVRSPLGVLWFGGENAQETAFQADPILVAGGRMFLYTRSRVMAVDVYTGQVLWKNGPRAGGPLPCYAAAADAFYSGGANREGLAQVVKLNVQTGEVAGELLLDKESGPLKEIRVWEETLIVTTPSRILAFDRHTLARRWQRGTASDIIPRLKVGYGKWRGGPSNHGLCVGGGKVFCIFGMTTEQLAALKRFGRTSEVVPVLFALDIKDGRTLWHREQKEPGAFLTWLAYSQQHDVLLQTMDFRVQQHGMETAWRGSDGKMLWSVDAQGHVGPPHIIRGDTVIPQSGSFYSLLTGQSREFSDPITRAAMPLDYHRTWHFGGCNYAIGSEHLLTFRNGTGGYCDLSFGCGTGFLGGDRSGCRNSLIVADGVLGAPSISGCGCNFPIRGASLALVSDDTADAWTYLNSRVGLGPVNRLGINLGAPGDRKSAEGTVWLEYPHVGGPSPPLKIEVQPEDAAPFSVHPSRMEHAEANWIAASGLEGVSSIRVPVAHYPREQQFSARWKGFLKPPKTAEYTLYARATDGVRVFLDGKLLIDGWQIPRSMNWIFPYRPYMPGARGYMTETVMLEQGKRYPIKVEYFHQGDTADLTLLWSSDAIAKQRIGTEFLSTSDGKPGVAVTWFEDLHFKGRSASEVVPGIGGRWDKSVPEALRQLGPRPELQTARRYTVHLYFAEPRELGPGERVFDVLIQDRPVLIALDITRSAGGPRRLLKKTFRSIDATSELVVQLVPRQGRTLLCGIEVVRD